jgi:hypothetical protein
VSQEGDDLLPQLALVVGQSLALKGLGGLRKGSVKGFSGFGVLEEFGDRL